MSWTIRLKDKVAIVTGASRGIGQAAALGLAEQGAKVVLAARSVDAIEATAARIREKYGNGAANAALAFPCDVTNQAQVDALVERTLAEYGCIDVLVNNAGYSKMMLIKDLSLAELKVAIDVNLIGTFLCSKAVLPTMKRQGGGKIINVVSGAGKRGTMRRGAYTASKFAVIGFSQVLQLECKEDGISVCCVCPGPVDTLMRSVNNPGEDKTKILPPEELAEAIVFAATRGPLTVISEMEVVPRPWVSF